MVHTMRKHMRVAALRGPDQKGTGRTLQSLFLGADLRQYFLP